VIAGKDISVCIPTIPPRQDCFNRAVASVRAQTIKPFLIVAAVDYDHMGAAVTRNSALEQVSTPWVAFLDDDDVLYPEHLEKLAQHAELTSADVVYSWPDVVGKGGDPCPEFFGAPFDPDTLRRRPFVHVTVLCRTYLIRRVGGFASPPEHEHLEDWGCWLRMLDAGAKFSHLPERTWRWNLHPGNTSGLGSRWHDEDRVNISST
jgi:glycosyltransferase involved in cell wall biosynthesis